MSLALTGIGTRSEAIKMAHVLRVLSSGGRFEGRLRLTGQIRDLPDRGALPQAAEYDLDIAEGALTEFVAAGTRGVGRVLRAWQSDVVLVQGDTTRAFVGVMAAFKERRLIGHIEALLRTGDLRSLRSNEGRRQAIDRLAMWMFAPTRGAGDRLIAEGALAPNVRVVGNTSLDAPLQVRRTASAPNAERLVLATIHRRGALHGICHAIAQVAQRWTNMRFVIPLHPTSDVRELVSAMLFGLPNIALVEPLDHPSRVALMVPRTATERREGVADGTARLVDSDTARRVAAFAELLESDCVLQSMSRVDTPNGDGYVADRIVGLLAAALGAESSTSTPW